MKGAAHVTNAESVILAALWRRGALTPAQLHAEVRALQPWAVTTIKTLLARLIHKRIVRSERIDGEVRYRPTIERGDYVESEVADLVERLFDGDRQALAAYLEQKPGA